MLLCGVLPSEPRLRALEDSLQRGCLVVGGGATLSTLRTACQSVVADDTVPHYAKRGVSAMDSMLRWFASTQIRNVATLAGNVVTASPISDMAPLLVACGAIIVAEAASGSLLGERRLRLISAQRMFVGYRRTALLPAEIIVAIVFPFERPFEYTFAYKQARRREDDITLVGAAFRVRLHPQTSTPLDGVACRYWGVASMGAAFAGMAPYTAQVPGTLSAMVSEAWCKDTLEAGLSALRLDLPLPDNVPGGTSRDGLVCDESRHCCRCSGSATCLMS